MPSYIFWRILLHSVQNRQYVPFSQARSCMVSKYRDHLLQVGFSRSWLRASCTTVIFLGRRWSILSLVIVTANEESTIFGIMMRWHFAYHFQIFSWDDRDFFDLINYVILQLKYQIFFCSCHNIMQKTKFPKTANASIIVVVSTFGLIIRMATTTTVLPTTKQR